MKSLARQYLLLRENGAGIRALERFIETKLLAEIKKLQTEVIVLKEKTYEPSNKKINTDR